MFAFWQRQVKLIYQVPLAFTSTFISAYGYMIIYWHERRNMEILVRLNVSL